MLARSRMSDPNQKPERKVEMRYNEDGSPKSIPTNIELEYALQTGLGLTDRTPPSAKVNQPFPRHASREYVQGVLRELQKKLWGTEPHLQAGPIGRDLREQIEVCKQYLKSK